MLHALSQEAHAASMIGARSGGPIHCKEPMALIPGSVQNGEGAELGVLEWHCPCGLRMDAGMLPMPFPADGVLLKAGQ